MRIAPPTRGGESTSPICRTLSSPWRSKTMARTGRAYSGWARPPPAARLVISSRRCELASSLLPRSEEVLRRRKSRRWTRSAHRERGVLRASRAEWRRQDDHHRDSRGSDYSRLRRSGSPRPHLAEERAGVARAHRNLVAGNAAQRKAHGPRDDPSLPLVLQARTESRRTAPRSFARGEEQLARRQTVGRAEAATCRGLRPGRRSRYPLSRRTDDRPRSAEPPPALGSGDELSSERRNGASHHALHGGSGAAVRPCRHRRSRASDRARHAEGVDRSAGGAEYHRIQQRAAAPC